jgi:hypothetical protein
MSRNHGVPGVRQCEGKPIAVGVALAFAGPRASLVRACAAAVTESTRWPTGYDAVMEMARIAEGVRGVLTPVHNHV